MVVVDIPESELALTLNDWENNLPDYISLSYLPLRTGIVLRLTAKGNDKNKLENSISKEVFKLSSLLGKHLLSVDTNRHFENNC